MTLSIFFTRISTAQQSGQEHFFCFVFYVQADMMFDTRFTFSSVNVAILIVSYCAYLIYNYHNYSLLLNNSIIRIYIRYNRSCTIESCWTGSIWGITGEANFLKKTGDTTVILKHNTINLWIMDKKDMD